MKISDSRILGVSTGLLYGVPANVKTPQGWAVSMIPIFIPLDYDCYIESDGFTSK